MLSSVMPRPTSSREISELPGRDGERREPRKGAEADEPEEQPADERTPALASKHKEPGRGECADRDWHAMAAEHPIGPAIRA